MVYTKEQQKAYRQAHRAEHRAHVRKYNKTAKGKASKKRYAQTPEHKEYQRKKSKLWHLKNYKPHKRSRLKFLTSEDQTIKRKARVKAQTAVKNGTLIKEKCFYCKSKYTQMHHPDYSKPLEVIWVCRNHHLDIHRNG